MKGGDRQRRGVAVLKGGLERPRATVLELHGVFQDEDFGPPAQLYPRFSGSL